MEVEGMEPVARDFMTRQAVCTHEDHSVRELCELLRREQITCVPVVDVERRVRGVVSVTDLLAPVGSVDVVSDFHTSPAMDNLAGAHRILQPPPSQLDRRVIEFMDRRWICVVPETLLSEVASVLVTQRIHRVLVMEGDRLLGVISVTDVLTALARLQPATSCSGP